MTDIVLISNQRSSAPDTVEIFYTSPVNGLGTRVKAFTAANSTTTSHTYKAYIYDSGGSLVSAVIPQTIVVRDRADYGSAIINQVIPKGGTLRIESSNADSINFYATGLEQ